MAANNYEQSLATNYMNGRKWRKSETWLVPLLYIAAPFERHLKPGGVTVATTTI